MFSSAKITSTLTITLLCAVSLVGCGDEEATSGSCDYPSTGVEAARAVEVPPSQTDLPESMTATLDLVQGPITIDLSPQETPCTVSNFAALAEQGYFDDTVCHRISLGLSILQCGDPTAVGSGNPGWTIPDELTGSETYGPGTVAMANTGSDDTGSAQFFLVYGVADLPPKYTVFGQMDEASVALLEKIGKTGTDSPTGDGAPKEQVRLESVTLS